MAKNIDTTVEVTRPLVTKTVEKFYVSFFNIDENLSNILGREVMSISRPNLSFNEFEIRHKGRRTVGETNIDYQPIDIVFYDDSESLVSRALYQQIRYQTGELTNNKESIRFDVTVKIYAIDGKLVEEYTIVDCHIQSIQHTESIINDTVKRFITASVNFNKLCYEFSTLD